MIYNSEMEKKPTELKQLRETIDDVLRPHISDSSYALLDFPDYFNPGDCAIWLGETNVLRRITGKPPAHIASIYSFDPSKLHQLPRSAPIFMQGGGNLGDLWPAHQQFRELVLREARDRKIVVLTQSIEFRTKFGLERARVEFGRHPNLTIFARDARSFEFAKTNFDCAVSLCPDFALALDLHRNRSKQSQKLIWLLRKDKEASGATLPSLETGQLDIDWPNPALLGRAWLHRLARIPGLALDVTADALARVRMQRGLAIISGARAVITDRLHGHVLSTLLGIPNVLLPDAFGKNKGLYETWTSGLPGTAFAHTREEALKKIEIMVGG